MPCVSICTLIHLSLQPLRKYLWDRSDAAKIDRLGSIANSDKMSEAPTELDRAFARNESRPMPVRNRPYLASATFHPDAQIDFASYPFNIPAVRDLPEIR